MKAREISHEKLIEYYPEILQAILEEIYEESGNFEHTEKQFSYCLYC